MSRKHGCFVLGLLSLAVAGGVLILATRDPDRFMRDQVAALRQRTVPPGAEVLEQRDATRSRSSAEASWEFRTPQAWAEYLAWVREKMSPDYRFVPGEAGKARAAFTRALNADSQNVDVEALTEASPMRVRVTFRSYAY